jgi:hypothetical protein
MELSINVNMPYPRLPIGDVDQSVLRKLASEILLNGMKSKVRMEFADGE